MPTPYLVDCLVQLRAEFNQQNPTRDKRSDGWIGDAAHQGRQSDHNPDPQGRVKAIDVDTTGPWPRGNTPDDYVEFIRLRHKNGDDDRQEYIIHNEHICSVSSNWNWETYSGTDPHIEHIHFSARHDNHGGTDGSAWGLGEVGAMADANVVSFSAAAQTVLQNKAQAGATIGVLSYAGGGLPTFDSGTAQDNFLNYFTQLCTAVHGLVTTVAAMQAQLNTIAQWQLDADSAGGDPSQAQTEIADAVWKNPSRTLS